MSKRRSTGQRRAEKVLDRTRRRRARPGGTACGRTPAGAVGGAGDAATATSRAAAGARTDGSEHPEVSRSLNAAEFADQVIATVLVRIVQVTVDSRRPDVAEALGARIGAIQDEYVERVDTALDDIGYGLVDVDALAEWLHLRDRCGSLTGC